MIDLLFSTLAFFSVEFNWGQAILVSSIASSVAFVVFIPGTGIFALTGKMLFKKAFAKFLATGGKSLAVGIATGTVVGLAYSSDTPARKMKQIKTPTHSSFVIDFLRDQNSSKKAIPFTCRIKWQKVKSNEAHEEIVKGKNGRHFEKLVKKKIKRIQPNISQVVIITDPYPGETVITFFRNFFREMDIEVSLKEFPEKGKGK